MGLNMLVKAGYFRQDENRTITAQFRVRELISFLDGGEVFCDHHLIKYCKYQTDVIVIGYGSSVYVYVSHVRWQTRIACRRLLRIHCAAGHLLTTTVHINSFGPRIRIQRGKYHLWSRSFTNPFNNSSNTTTIPTSGQELTQFSNS